jgi:hypothetical protein
MGLVNTSQVIRGIAVKAYENRDFSKALIKKPFGESKKFI